MTRLRDLHIRNAAKSRLLVRALSCYDTRVVEELGLSHGAARIDIAVLNGHLRGIEIKAEADTLVRLPRQVAAYGQVVDFATLITTERHLDPAIAVLPPWWGVVLARKTSQDVVEFKRLRAEKMNKNLEPSTLVKLLWRSEAIEILRNLGVDERILRAPRAALYAEIVSLLPIAHLRRTVREILKTRENWRGRAVPS